MPTSSSKIEYLSKYNSSSSDRKDQKKKKTKKRSKRSPVDQTIHDIEDEELVFLQTENGDDNDEEDEGPVVVDTPLLDYFASSATSRSGGAYNNENAVPSTSDSRDRRTFEHDDSIKNAGKRSEQAQDSSSAQSDGGKWRHQQNRRQYDSDHSNHDEKAATTHQRRRFDSDENSSEDERQVTLSSSERRRHDSASGGGTHDEKNRIILPGERRRRRYDSESDHSDDNEKRRNNPHGVSLRKETIPDISRSTNAIKTRHDSSDEGSKDSDGSSRKRLSSGHQAGLQRYDDFNKSEVRIRKQKHEEAQKMVDKYGMGDTVYRDQHGRKTDLQVSSNGNSSSQKDLEAHQRLNQGKVQRQLLEAQMQEIDILKQSSFARHQDDDRLEDLRKREIRKGDPMAHYSANPNSNKKRKKSDSPDGHSGSAERSGKPFYKGPPPKPNRYGIQPGYRWDGVDRGNGFEDKILEQMYSAKQKEERAYRWRSADM